MKYILAFVIWLALVWLTIKFIQGANNNYLGND